MRCIPQVASRHGGREDGGQPALEEIAGPDRGLGRDDGAVEGDFFGVLRSVAQIQDQLVQLCHPNGFIDDGLLAGRHNQGDFRLPFDEGMALPVGHRRLQGRSDFVAGVAWDRGQGAAVGIEADAYLPALPLGVEGKILGGHVLQRAVPAVKIVVRPGGDQVFEVHGRAACKDLFSQGFVVGEFAAVGVEGQFVGPGLPDCLEHQVTVGHGVGQAAGPALEVIAFPDRLIGLGVCIDGLPVFP